MRRIVAYTLAVLLILGTLFVSDDHAQQPVAQSAALAQITTLQNAAVANGNGTSMNVSGMAVVTLTANCSLCSGTQVNFEVSEGQSFFIPRQAIRADQPSQPSQPYTRDVGFTVWEIPVAGYATLRARISNYTAGTVTVTGHAVPIGQTAVISGALVASVVNQVTQYFTANNTLRTPFRFQLTGPLNTAIGGSPASPLYAFNTNPPDPCVAYPAVLAISQTANTKLVSGVPGQRIYICSIAVVGADSENLSVVEGVTGACTTTAGAVIGGLTAANGMNFAANSGFGFGNGQSWFARTAFLGSDMCLFQSGAGRVAGVLKYALAP